jgi:hypothetical protein
MRKLVKLSPPFEGGVAGTIDYQVYISFISRPGWLILGKYHRILKDENRDNNQPPRPQISFSKTNKHFTAATPPSKGGESFFTIQ